MGEELHGIGVSPGFAAGPVYRVALPPRLPEVRTVPADRVVDEIGRAEAALAAVVSDLKRRADLVGRPAVADILRAEAMMADDPVLRDSVADSVRQGVDGAHAIDRAFAAHREAFVAVGGYSPSVSPIWMTYATGRWRSFSISRCRGSRRPAGRSSSPLVTSRRPTPRVLTRRRSSRS